MADTRDVIPKQWYRVDKGDGRLLAVNSLAVVRAAQGSYNRSGAVDVIRAGRFSTPFAIYSRGDQLTANEKAVQ